MEEEPYGPSHVAEDNKRRQTYRSKQIMSGNLHQSQRHPWRLVLLLGKWVNNLDLTREYLENLLKMGSFIDHNGREYKKEYICIYIYLNVVQKLTQPCKSTAHQLKNTAPLAC